MDNAIQIQVPISISYPALEGVLKKKMVGEYIPRAEEGATEPPYAQILDIGIAGSSAGNNRVVLNIRIRVLRTILKRDHVDLQVQASLGYNTTSQLLFVRTFKLDARTSSSFYNGSLEFLANNVAYNQILKKTRFNLREIIGKELLKANGMLESGLESKGLTLTGAITELRVQDIRAEPDKVNLLVMLQGNVAADVFDLLSLMPPA
jgi:hypothetical protein